MFSESKIFNNIRNRNANENGIAYEEQAYSELDPETRENFFSERKKRLGYSYRMGGSNTNVLISGSHAMDLIKIKGTDVSQQEIGSLNQVSENKKPRYKRSEDGSLLIGKQYIGAGQRNRSGYRADSNVASMCIELQDSTGEGQQEKTPHLLLYEMPQVYSEPNKIDSANIGTEVVDLEVYEKNGLKKLADYIRKFGLGKITSKDVMAIKRGRYSEAADAEEDLVKKEVLLESEQAIKGLDRNNLAYKEVIASLGVMGIHRSYYEEQERLLYEETNSQYPLNLEIHTCFDSHKKREGIDVIIGTRLGSTCDPEAELLLSLILKKHGFSVNLSTLNNFSQKNPNRQKASLRNFLDIQAGLLDKESKNEFARLSALEQEADLKAEIMENFEARLDKMLMDGERGRLERFLEDEGISKERTPSIDEPELKEMCEQAYRDSISKINSPDDLRLVLGQNFLSLELSGITHDDRLKGGLLGLTSLQSKFQARDKYITETRPEIHPEIFQVEIVSSIMNDRDKRAKVREALGEFLGIMQTENLDLTVELQNIAGIADNVKKS